MKEVQISHPINVQQRLYYQKPSYFDEFKLQEVTQKLKKSDGIVPIFEIMKLNSLMESVFQRKSFILQVGDCAERFKDDDLETIQRKLWLYEKLKKNFQQHLNLPEVVLIGRIAGQFAKPRSYLQEKDGLPVYRGDAINSFEHDQNLRVHDPERLLLAYHKSQKIFSHIRSIDTNVYTSHECLVLEYEQSLTRMNYDSSAHFLWIGERTRHPDGAHAEFAQHILNPIGVKIGPEATTEEIAELVRRLTENNKRKVLLIPRFGINKLVDKLPRFIRDVETLKLPVIWSVDPMHGNTRISDQGFKVRSFSDIQKEFYETARIHQQMGTYLAGVHLEVTHEDVQECVYSSNEIIQPEKYLTYCDPRLNEKQCSAFFDIL